MHLNLQVMKNRPLSELVIDFINDQDVNELSKKTYKLAISRFVRWVVFSTLEFWSLKKKDIINYKSVLLREGKSLYTIDLYLTVVRKLYSWLDDQGLYENIAVGVRSPKKDKKFRKGYLKMEQVDLLLSSIDTSLPIGKRDYCIISMMLGAGLRRVEICRMTIGDVTNNFQTTMRLQRKGHNEKDTELGITERMLGAIHDYLLCRNNFSEDSPLFVNHAGGYKDLPLQPAMVSRMIKQRFKQIGIVDKRMTCHSLRHTAAIQALKAGADVYEVQQMLGHSDIKTTTIYLRAIEEETRVNNRAVRILDKVLSESLGEGKNKLLDSAKYQ